MLSKLGRFCRGPDDVQEARRAKITAWFCLENCEQQQSPSFTHLSPSAVSLSYTHISGSLEHRSSHDWAACRCSRVFLMGAVALFPLNATLVFCDRCYPTMALLRHQPTSGRRHSCPSCLCGCVAPFHAWLSLIRWEFSAPPALSRLRFLKME